MSEHTLKIMRRPFIDLQSGAKTGEVRSCADRDFQVGDTVVLSLIDETGNPAGQSLRRSITHIQRGYGLPEDICVLSYAQPSDGALTNEPFCYTTAGMVEVAKAIQAGSGIGRVGAKLAKDDRFCVPLHLSPPAPASTGFADGIDAAAKLIERRMDEYVNEHGSYDHDTGYTEFPGNGEETVEEWMNLAESIRAIKP